MAFPPSLIQAYRETRYSVYFDGGERTIFVVDRPPRGRAPSRSVTVVTAWNPGLQRPGKDENRAANARLEAALRERGHVYYPAKGESAGGTHAEPSFAVMDLTQAQAISLGREFGQAAVFHWDGTRAELLWC
jgi:hypothetical protein